MSWFPRILTVFILCVVHVSWQREQDIVSSQLTIPRHQYATAILISTIFVTSFLLVFTLYVTYTWEVSNLSPETRQNHGKCLAATSLSFLFVSTSQLAIVYGDFTSQMQHFLHIVLWINLFILAVGFQIFWKTYGCTENNFDGKAISRMFIYIWVIVMSMLVVVLIGWLFDELNNKYRAALAFSFSSPPLAMMIAKNFQYARSFNESFAKENEKVLSDYEIQNGKRFTIHLFAVTFVSTLLICTPLIAHVFEEHTVFQVQSIIGIYLALYGLCLFFFEFVSCNYVYNYCAISKNITLIPNFTVQRVQTNSHNQKKNEFNIKL